MGSKSYLSSYIDIFAATNFSLLRNQCEQNYLFFNHAETEIYFQKPEIENVWNFLCSDIKNAWSREQLLQWEEIENRGRRVPEALDGQRGTPGYNASYYTFSSINTQKDEIFIFQSSWFHCQCR